VSLDRTGRLVYSAVTAEGSGVYTRRPGEREPVLVVDNAFDPKVTADGRIVVFQRSRGTVGLYRVSIDGSGVRLLADGDASDGVIVPNNDQTVLFLSDRSGERALWSVSLAGGPPREVLRRFVSRGSLRVSPDGRRLVFVAGVNLEDGRQVGMVCDLPDCANLRDVPVRSNAGRWTPDNRGLAYVDRADPTNIWVQRLDGGASRQLTAFTDKDIVDFAFSPDGTRLAVTRRTQLSDMVLIKGFR
jgi:Tol biopolymer transport system component